MRFKSPAWLLAASVFSLCLAGTAAAQGKPAGAGPPPNINPNLDDRARQVDEGRLRSAEVDARSDEKNQKLVQAAIANMKEDYTRIQVLRNDIALVKLCKLIDSFTENPALKNAATLDAKDVAKAKENKARADQDLRAIIKLSGSLKKRAESLKTSQ